MPKFNVTVEFNVVGLQTIEVDAPTEDAACDAALSKVNCGEYDAGFGELSSASIWDIEGVEG